MKQRIVSSDQPSVDTLTHLILLYFIKNHVIKILLIFKYLLRADLIVSFTTALKFGKDVSFIVFLHGTLKRGSTIDRYSLNEGFSTIDTGSIHLISILVKASEWSFWVRLFFGYFTLTIPTVSRD